MRRHKIQPRPRKRRADADLKYDDFVDAVIAADGEWIEAPLEGRSASNAPGAVARAYTWRFIDVVTHDGVMYARMKERGR